jgi:outer membrane protein assembly factor BamB
MNYRLFAIAVIGMLFAAPAVQGFAAVDSLLASSTYRVWGFTASGDVLASSPVGDVSGDGIKEIAVATDDKSVYLLDGSTGQKIWTFVANDFYPWALIAASPDADGGEKLDVLVATENGLAIMLDGSTGKQIWNFTRSETYRSSELCFPATRSFHLISDADGDGLPDFVGVSGSGDGCPKDDKFALTALSSKTGQKIWEFAHEEDYHGIKDGNRKSSPVAIADLNNDGREDVAIVDERNVMYTIDGLTGKALETGTVKGVFGSIWNLMVVPDVSGDGVDDAIAFEFIDGGGGPDYASVGAIDLAAAEMIWQVKAGDGLYNGGALYSAAWLDPYVAATLRVESELQLVLLSAETGEQAWQFDLGEEKGRSDIDKYYPVSRVPDLTGNGYDEIAVGEIGSDLQLLDGKEGSTVWTHHIDGQISGIDFIETGEGQAYVIVEDQYAGMRALAGLTEIKTELAISASAQEISLTPLPDKVTISGTISPSFPGEIIEIRYIDPTGAVTARPLVVAKDGSYTDVIEPELVGTWKVSTQFKGEGYYLDANSPTVTFTVREEMENPVYMLQEGSVSYPIAYSIEGGEVTGMAIDKDKKSVDISVASARAGSLTVKLPKSIIDAPTSSLQVYLDGRAVQFDEESDDQSRTLSIPLSEGAKQVQVMGTYIVPEFSALTSGILAATIIGTIAATAAYRRTS